MRKNKRTAAGRIQRQPANPTSHSKERHPDYIIGNPPFVGKSFQTEEQKNDMKLVFDGVKNYGNLDYVASWYKKCADLMEGTRCNVDNN